MPVGFGGERPLLATRQLCLVRVFLPLRSVLFQNPFLVFSTSPEQVPHRAPSALSASTEGKGPVHKELKVKELMK